MALTDAGERVAWEALAALDPADVCARAAVAHDPAAGTYLLDSFGTRFAVSPSERTILSLEPAGEVFLKRFAYFFRLSVLGYLAKAAAVAPAGTLVNPSGLPGGEIYFRGSHVLPLDGLAARYGSDATAFLAAGAARGGHRVAHGDAAVELPALPRVPATLILWTADVEFPARADLLFDATAPRHLPLDLLWSVAMMSTLSMM